MRTKDKLELLEIKIESVAHVESLRASTIHKRIDSMQDCINALCKHLGVNLYRDPEKITPSKIVARKVKKSKKKGG